MDNLALPTQPTVAPPAGAAAPVAVQTPAPAPMPSMPYDTGGMPPAAKPGFFSGVTVVDVGIFAIVSLALFYSIYYHRTMILNAKVWKTNQQNQIDEVKSNVQAFLGPDYKSFS